MPEDVVIRRHAPPRDSWALLQGNSPARLALGRCGASLPTREVLSFAAAHACARDAVHATLNTDALANTLAAAGQPTLVVQSRAANRGDYLRNPGLGRELDAASADLLREAARPVDATVIIADGLSAAGINAHAAAVAIPLLQALGARRVTTGPVILALQSRVALADDIGEILSARISIILIGERPGLSAADSIGAYLTFAPRRGATDAQRNCVSNIRPNGLDGARAAEMIAWMVAEALQAGFTGPRLRAPSSMAPLPRAVP